MKKNKNALFKSGVKDDKVYFEIWNGEETKRIVDGHLTPKQAYDIGMSLVDSALKQGYSPLAQVGIEPTENM